MLSFFFWGWGGGGGGKGEESEHKRRGVWTKCVREWRGGEGGGRRWKKDGFSNGGLERSRGENGQMGWEYCAEERRDN